MKHAAALARSTEPDDRSPEYCIGQRVIVTNRGPATIATRVLPGLWGVDFIGLEGFGYVFEDDMRQIADPFADEREVKAA